MRDNRTSDVSGDTEVRPLAESAARPAGLAQAFEHTGSIIHRVRYHEELVLVEKHVHAEALTIRDPALQQTRARGVRIVMRSQPVEEPPPDARRVEFTGWTPEITPAWLDAVPVGPPFQECQTVFLDDADIPGLLEELDGLAHTADRWNRNEVYSTSDWFEAVFAWSDAFVVGLLRRGLKQECYVGSRAPLRLHFPVPEHRLGRFRRWLKKAKEGLDEAP